MSVFLKTQRERLLNFLKDSWWLALILMMLGISIAVHKQREIEMKEAKQKRLQEIFREAFEEAKESVRKKSEGHSQSGSTNENGH